MQITNSDGSFIGNRVLTGGMKPGSNVPSARSFARTLGTTMRRDGSRIVDYSEVSHSKGTGDISFLQGSTIDESTFSLMYEPKDLDDIHAVYDALANLPHKQYRWKPNPNNNNGLITGYRKELNLSLLENGEGILRIKVLGIQNIALTDIRIPPMIAVRGGNEKVNIYTYPTTGQEIQSSIFPDGPWETIIENSTQATNSHSSLVSEAIYYYRARKYEASNNSNPWSVIVSAWVQ